MAHNCLDEFTTCIECGCVLMGHRASPSAQLHYRYHERHRDRHNAASQRLDAADVYLKELDEQVIRMAARLGKLEPPETPPCHDFSAVTGFPPGAHITAQCGICGVREVWNV